MKPLVFHLQRVQLMLQGVQILGINFKQGILQTNKLNIQVENVFNLVPVLTLTKLSHLSYLFYSILISKQFYHIISLVIFHFILVPVLSQNNTFIALILFWFNLVPVLCQNYHIYHVRSISISSGASFIIKLSYLSFSFYSISILCTFHCILNCWMIYLMHTNLMNEVVLAKEWGYIDQECSPLFSFYEKAMQIPCSWSFFADVWQLLTRTTK